jgi:hypothetical protein
MKPNLSMKDQAITALGDFHSVHQQPPGSMSRPARSNPSRRESPYLGICVSSASELLDFGFENAEILQGEED